MNESSDHTQFIHFEDEYLSSHGQGTFKKVNAAEFSSFDFFGHTLLAI